MGEADTGGRAAGDGLAAVGDAVVDGALFRLCVRARPAGSSRDVATGAEAGAGAATAAAGADETAGAGAGGLG